MRRGLIAILAAILAIVGAGLIIIYVNGADDRALAELEPTPVLVVTQTVPAGTAAAAMAEFTETRELPRSAVVEGALSDLEDVDANHVTSTDIFPGEQLVSARFLSPDSTELTVAVPLPDEAQLMSIQLEPQRVLGGRLQAGDTVGIYLSRAVTYEGETDEEDLETQETHALAHQVLVARVQGAAAATTTSEEGTAEQTPSNDLIVTLAVDAALAERIIFGQEWGRLWLSHERESSDTTGTRIVNPGNIFEP